jgi:hypothetical protein
MDFHKDDATIITTQQRPTGSNKEQENRRTGSTGEISEEQGRTTRQREAIESAKAITQNSGDP